MTQDSQPSDLILATRLDVLDQAVDEVDRVIEAMEEQSIRLNDVEDRLWPAGFLAEQEDRLLTMIGDASRRLDLYVNRRTPGTVTRVTDPRRPAPDAGRNVGLVEALESLKAAERLVVDLAACRTKAYESFQDVRRWSVAGLGDGVLRDAVRDYQRLIREIRDAANPWRRYQDELPRRGQELFTRYLELLAGMAVRGFGLDANITSDVDALIEQLLEPVGDDERPPEHERSPLALMGLLGKRHVPLGYPEWSLWALPLVGRTVGELVVNSFIRQGTVANIDSRNRVFCADLYAQYVLGPTYLHAAVFLEFDPSPEPPGEGMPNDSLRASLLLEYLPTLNDSAYADVLESIADKVRAAWARARAAVGGAEMEIDDATRQVLEGFLDSLGRKYPEVAYEASRIPEIAGIGRRLLPAADGTVTLPKVDLQMREIITAMWLARMEDPGQARLIHEGAKALARQTPVLPFNRSGRRSNRLRPQTKKAPWVS